MQIGSVGTQMLTNQVSAVKEQAAGDFAAQLKAAEAAGDDKDTAKLKAVCRDMESVFLNLLLSKMRDSVPKSGLMGDSSAENIMQSMLDSEMTKNMSQAGGMGLADMLYRQLTVTAGVQNKSQAR